MTTPGGGVAAAEGAMKFVSAEVEKPGPAVSNARNTRTAIANTAIPRARFRIIAFTGEDSFHRSQRIDL
jgi:hypothetical protein